MMRDLLGRLIEGEDLDFETVVSAVGSIVQEEATPAQVGAFLTAMRLKGETQEEIAGAATALRERAVAFPAAGLFNAIDTCGTGGDGAGTVNVSTLSALVAAGAGVKVAKHGNRAVSSKCGSADLLVSLGVKVDASPTTAARCLDEANFAFLFAPLYHPAMKAVAPFRAEMGFRTLFNMIGPLCNPAGVRKQLLGVFAEDLLPLMAGVLGRLGCDRAMVVSSQDGLDELSISSPTSVAELDEAGDVTFYQIDPASFGIGPYEKGSLAGGTPEENAEISLEFLSGAVGPVRDAALLNAAAAIMLAGSVNDMAEGLAAAAEAVDSGAAMTVLERVRDICREDA